MGTVKAVSFKKKEQNLVDFIGDRDFSYYIKELIRKDMEGKVTGDTSSRNEKPPIRRRNTKFDM